MKKMSILCIKEVTIAFQIYRKIVDSCAAIIKMFIFVLDNTVSALVIRTLYLFKGEYAVVTNPVTVKERVILKSTSAPDPAQSEVCSETSNLGIERDHVALQSGIGQVLIHVKEKNMQNNAIKQFSISVIEIVLLSSS